MRKFAKLIKKLPLIWIITLLVPVFVVLLYLYRFSSALQFRVVIVAAAAYLGVALAHHYKDKSLTLEIVIEYILTAALALIVIRSSLLG